MRLVIVETPYAGHAPRWARFFPPLAWLLAAVQRRRNVRYARACVRDCLLRDEAPIASHLLYTQPGVLRDGIDGERTRGIVAGLAWGLRADVTVAYTDLGTSIGMQIGITHACRNGRKVERRSLPGWRVARIRAGYRRAQIAILLAGLALAILVAR